MSTDALLEYFKPLQEFLAAENQRSESDDKIHQMLSTYNTEASKQCHKVQIADWDRTTDLNNKTKEEIYARAVAENAEFIKEQNNRYFKHLNPNDYNDGKIQRQIKLIRDLGTNALSERRLLELTDTISEMVLIYNQAEFCGYQNQNCSKDQRLTLDPGRLFEILN